MTIGTYEVPIWAERGWLEPLDSLPDDYNEDDLLASVRDGLSLDGTLHALPFYAESSMMYYRTDLFEQAGIEMPEQPTWAQVRDWPNSSTVAKRAWRVSVCAASRAGARTWPLSRRW